MIADGEDGILVFIRKQDLLPLLSNNVINKAKLEITISQKENNYITTDECGNIELDTEVKRLKFPINICIKYS